MFKKIDKSIIKESNPEIVEWNRCDIPSKGTECDPNLIPLMYKFPPSGSDFKKVVYFAVKDYERVLFFEKGQLIDELKGGIYGIAKDARKKGTEIIWFDSSIQSIKWGIPQDPGLLTKDNYFIGLSGEIKIRIRQVKRFFSDVVGTSQIWTLKDLKFWLKSILHSVLRDIIKIYNGAQLLREERTKLEELLIAKISPDLMRYGLEMDSFSILNIKLPDILLNIITAGQEYNSNRLESMKQEQLHLYTLQNELLTQIQDLNSKLNSIQNEYLDGNISDDDYHAKILTIESMIQDNTTRLRIIQDHYRQGGN